MTKLILHADKFPWCLTELDGVELDMLTLLYFGEKDRINKNPTYVSLHWDIYVLYIGLKS